MTVSYTHLDVYKRQVWKCTQTLNTPSGYSGGPVRLELIQNVNGTPTASVVLEDQVIQFPYDLDITGAPGISEGTLYLSEPVSYTHLDVYKRQQEQYQQQNLKLQSYMFLLWV